MHIIDKVAYESKLKNVNSFLKFIISISTLFLCIGLRNNIFSILIFIMMSYAIVGISGLKLQSYLKLCSIPLVFIFFSMITITINISNSNTGIFSLSIFSKYLVITNSSLEEGINLFLTSISSIACIYFLYTTTTMNGLFKVLNVIKVPDFFIELMMLIYRFIFILLNIMEDIKVAQNSRLGNVSFKSKLTSTASISSTLFIKAFKKTDDIFNAMESRGYDGTFYLESNERISKKEIIILIIYEAVMIILAVLVFGRSGGFIG